MNMDFTEVKVDPNELRFSQDSIATYVRTPWGQNVSLNENLKKLKSGELHPDHFPQLEVSRDEDGMLWSNDNRRLWLFRRAGISQITVKLFSKPLFRAPPRSDSDRDLMSSPNFFPRIRRQPRKPFRIPTQQRHIDTEAVINVDPNTIRFSQTCIDPYFTSRSGQYVLSEENLKKLKSGQLHLDDFLPLDVSRDEDGVLWSNDNEKLWLFRKAGIARIAVKVFRKPLSRAPPRTDRDRALMFSQDFFPTIRGQSQKTAPKSTKPKADNSDAEVKLNPNLIRFSEKSIAANWTKPSYKSLPLEETLKRLQSGQVHLVDFPPLDVSRDEDGVLWSNDNEGLWLCRKAGISPITVKISRKPLSRAPPRIDRDRALMSSPDFFPTIRGQSQETGSTSTNPKADNIDSVVKLNPNAIRFSEKSIGPYWTKSSGRNVLLEEILKILEIGQVSPEVFQPLEVSRDKNGVLWANANEELWFLRKAGVSQISVKVSSMPFYRPPQISDSDQNIMSSPDFFPTIRAQSQETGSSSSNPEADNIDSVVKLNPNAIRFSEKSIGPYWTKSSGRNVTLEEILEILESGRLSPEDFQPLEVSRDKDGVLWANDSCALWFLRKAGVSEIRVEVSSRPFYRAPQISDSDQNLMSSPDFFPTIRGQYEETGSAWTNVNADDIVGLLVGAAATATAIFLGFSGWKLSALAGCAVWKLYKKSRE